MIKRIFCDLDGTLYNEGVSKKDSDAIKRAEANGLEFNIATGRIFKQGYNMIKNDVDLKGYFICENGSFIYDSSLNIIFKGTLTDDISRRIITKFDEIEKNKHAEAQLYFKYKGDTVIMDEGNAFKHYSKDYVYDPDFSKKESFDNMIGNIGVACEDPKELERIEVLLKEEFENDTDIYFSSELTLNIVPKGVSKKAAIDYVIEIEGIKPEEVATIGDSPNDISMLEGYEYGFAMEKARADVKKAASYVSANVSDAIDKIIKINSEK